MDELKSYDLRLTDWEGATKKVSSLDAPKCKVVDAPHPGGSVHGYHVSFRQSGTTVRQPQDVEVLFADLPGVRLAQGRCPMYNV